MPFDSFGATSYLFSMKKIFLSLVLVIPFLTMAQNEMQVKGVVKERYTNHVLQGATVFLEELKQTVITDDKGQFSLKLRKGSYMLKVTYLGYRTSFKHIQISDKDKDVAFFLEKKVVIADEVLVIATRAKDYGEATYVNLSKEEIEKQNFGQDIPVLLNTLPSMNMSSDAGNGVGYTAMRIRGSDATAINVTLNGIPYNDSESQLSYFVDIPDMASSTDGIQVQRGVGTSANGAGAFGGSINIQTTQASDVPYAEANATYGSFNTYKTTFKVGTGIINQHFSFDGRFSRIASDGYIDRANSSLDSYYLSMAYLGNKSVLRFNAFSGQEQTYQAWNGVPQYQIDQGNRTYNVYNYIGQTDNYKQDHFQLLYDKTPNEQWDIKTALHYTYGRGYYQCLNASYDNDVQQNPVDFGLDTHGGTVTQTNIVYQKWLQNHFYGTTFSVKYKPSSRMNFTWGGAANQYVGAHYGKLVSADGYTDQEIADIGKYYSDNTLKNDINTFLKTNLIYGKTNLFLDLQYRNIGYWFYELDAKGEQKTSDKQRFVNHNFFNPKTGISYKINQYNNIYTSFAIANREPNRDDYVLSIQSTRPKSEQLYDVESGYRFQNSIANLGVNFYGMYYKDQLVKTGKLNNVGASIRQNVPESYRMGVELEATLKLSEKFKFLANSTLSRNKITSLDVYFDSGYYTSDAGTKMSYKNVDISYSPNLIGFAELQYKPYKGIELAFNGKYIGTQYLDNTQNEGRKIDAYLVNNARLTYDIPLKWARKIQISALLNNLFSVKYYNNAWTYAYYDASIQRQENSYYPQALVNYMLMLKVKL